MSVFFDNSITDAGRLLWAEMQAGGSFVPTKIVIGAGYLPTGKTVRTMTSVAEPIQEIALNKTEKLNGGDYVFGGVFTNKEVTAAFYYRELALYAKVSRDDGTETAETLYSYGNAGSNAELIPAYSTGTAIERQLDILSYIGNDANVTVEIETGVYVSSKEFNAKIDEIKGNTDKMGSKLGEISDELNRQAEEIEKKITQDIGELEKRLDSDEEKITKNAEDITDLQKKSENIESMIVVFENISVQPGEFVPDQTYVTHPHKAVIDAEGITTDYIADVVFGPKDAISGILAPVSKTGAGSVTIYANEVPAEPVLILTIECRRVGGNTESGGSGGGVEPSDISTDAEVNSVINQVFS